LPKKTGAYEQTMVIYLGTVGIPAMHLQWRQTVADVCLSVAVEIMWSCKTHHDLLCKVNYSINTIFLFYIILANMIVLHVD